MTAGNSLLSDALNQNMRRADYETFDEEQIRPAGID